MEGSDEELVWGTRFVGNSAERCCWSNCECNLSSKESTRRSEEERLQGFVPDSTESG